MYVEAAMVFASQARFAAFLSSRRGNQNDSSAIL
jgi:hypothetical protein